MLPLDIEQRVNTTFIDRIQSRFKNSPQSAHAQFSFKHRCLFLQRLLSYRGRERNNLGIRFCYA